MIHDFLIVGAGLAGVKAAGDLSAAGRSVLVLDKGRGVGGRAATRRWDSVPVDHGAQFFTARADEFRAQVDDWLARGVCFTWCYGFSQWDDNGEGIRAPDPEDRKHPRYACRAGMSALTKDLARALPEAALRLKSRVVKLACADGHWQAQVEGDETREPAAGRELILALPVTQALDLLRNSGLLDGLDPAVRESLEPVEYKPTLAAILRGPAPAPGWQGIQLRDETLAWISDDTSKRAEGGREDKNGGAAPSDAARIFVLHARSAFSREWQDGDLEEATRLMTARAGELVGDWITKLPDRQMHRWRFATPVHGVVKVSSLRDGGADRPPLHVCGDAFNGAKIEGAYSSGLGVAKAILGEG